MHIMAGGLACMSDPKEGINAKKSGPQRPRSRALIRTGINLAYGRTEDI